MPTNMTKEFILSSPSHGVYDVLMRIEHENRTPLLELKVLSFSNYDKARDTVESLQKMQKLATF